MSDRAATELLALLAEEKRAIRGADFGRLDALAERKTMIFAALPRGGTHPDDLERIQRALAENHTLLSAAIAGVKAAKARIVEMQAVQRELTVYDRTGQLAPVKTTQAALEKKA